MEPKIIEKILNAYKNGATFREIEKQFKLSEGIVFRTIQQYATSKIREQHNTSVIARQQKKKDQDTSSERIWKDLESGMVLHKIADKHGISYSTFVNRIKKYAEKNGIKEVNGVKIEEILIEGNIEKVKYTKKKVDIPLERIIEDRTSGKKMTELAKEYGVGVNSLYERLRNSGIKLKRGRKRAKEIISKVPIEVLVEEVSKGATLVSLSKKYDIPVSTIWHHIARYEQENDVKIRKSNVYKEHKKITENNAVEHKKETKQKVKTENKDKMKGIWREYTKGIPITELSSRYGIGEATLRKYLNRYQDYLLTQAYVKQNKSVAEISREANLPILNVKERIIRVLKEKTPNIDLAWYMIKRSQGHTVEETLKMYMLQQTQATQQMQKSER